MAEKPEQRLEERQTTRSYTAARGKAYFDYRRLTGQPGSREGREYFYRVFDRNYEYGYWAGRFDGQQQDAPLVEAVRGIAASACCETPGCSVANPLCDAMTARAAMHEAGITR